jgi:hypothetical protein
MTKLELLSAGLVAAAMLATPAMARQHHVTSRHLAADTYGSTTPAARYVDGRLCYPAPRVGAFATQPWDNGNVPCEPGSGY